MNDKRILDNVINKFGWDIGKAENAIKMYTGSGTVLDPNRVLTLSIESEDPRERIMNFTNYIYDKLSGDYYLFIRVIPKLFQVDPSVYVVALFNIMDYSRDEVRFEFLHFREQLDAILRNEDYRAKYHKDKPPDFGPFKYRCRPFINEVVNHEYCDGIKLTYEIIDRIVYEVYSDWEYYEDWDSIDQSLFAFAKRVGLPIFNVDTLRAHVNHLWQSTDRHRHCSQLLDHINKSFLSSTKVTRRNYWLIYILVSILIENELAPKFAYKRVGRILDERELTVKRRYFEMKKEAQTINKSLETIIKEYQLEPLIIKYLSDYDQN